MLIVLISIVYNTLKSKFFLNTRNYCELPIKNTNNILISLLIASRPKNIINTEKSNPPIGGRNLLKYANIGSILTCRKKYNL